MDKQRLQAQIAAIDKLNGKLKGCRLLKSVEVDILEDGSLDMPDDVLKELDLVVAAVHYKLDLPDAKQTRRLLKAMDNRYFHILAHPSGRLINERPPMDYDFERVVRAPRSAAVAWKWIPSQTGWTDDAHCKLAKEMGVKIAISSDAHSVDGLGMMRFGVDQARRGWLEAGDVLNTLPLAKLLQTLER